MFKFIHRYARGRWERYYLKSHWHLILDLSLFMVIIILAAAVFSLYFYRPSLPWIGAYNPPTVDLNNPPLDLSYSVASPVIKIKDAAVLRINFKNNGTVVINNVVINLSSVDPNFTISKLETVSDNLTINGRQIVLTSVKSGESGEAALKIYFNSKESSSRTINWRAQSEYFLGGQLLKEAVNLPILKLAAELNIKAAVYYTSPQGDQLGVGPVPPIVGIPTSYWIFWEAKSNGDFKNLVLSARLPKGIELGSNRSLLAGEFSYSTSSRQIIWKVPQLKGNDDNYRVGFEIKLIPVAEQVGHVLPLLTQARYYGQDALTIEESAGSLSNLTTNLETDRFNSGQGQVVNQ